MITRREVLRGAAAVIALPYCTSRARAASTAIDQRGFVRIGGIDQWVAVQGSNDTNPIILFLHGGPGEAQSPFLAEFVPWERDFTVVNYDQRGSGKTYGRNGASTPDMTVERMSADAVEVAQYALKKLAKPKLVLVGHSWGALLGLHAVTMRPDLFYAFVGTGQPVNWTLTIENRERWARKQAAAENDAVALKALNDAAMLPAGDTKRMMASSKWRFSESDKQYLELERAFVGAPPFPTKGDVADWIAGGDFTGPKVWAEIGAFDARSQFGALPLPFFVIQGRDDHTVSYDAAQAYVAQVRAPVKAFIPIDGGHFACFTDPTEFLAAMRAHVMPLIAQDAR